MFDLLSKGNLLAILRNEERWEILIISNECKIQRFIYEKSIYRLLRELSTYYHRCYREEQKMISNEYGITQKVPILINPHKILLFQNKSFNHPECVLLNYYCIYKYKKVDKSTYIKFCIPYNHNKIILEDGMFISCDRRIIDNQYKRCMKIDRILKERIVI